MLFQLKVDCKTLESGLKYEGGNYSLFENQQRVVDYWKRILLDRGHFTAKQILTELGSEGIDLLLRMVRRLIDVTLRYKVVTIDLGRLIELVLMLTEVYHIKKIEELERLSGKAKASNKKTPNPVTTSAQEL